MSLCDAYDMMVNNSVYSPKKNIKEALDEIKKHSGTQFDPDLAKQFIEFHKNKKNDE